MQYAMPVWAEKRKEKIVNQNNINLISTFFYNN
jgi:hypothetical protein